MEWLVHLTSIWYSSLDYWNVLYTTNFWHLTNWWNVSTVSQLRAQLRKRVLQTGQNLLHTLIEYLRVIRAKLCTDNLIYTIVIVPCSVVQKAERRGGRGCEESKGSSGKWWDGWRWWNKWRRSEIVEKLGILWRLDWSDEHQNTSQFNTWHDGF